MPNIDDITYDVVINAIAHLDNYDVKKASVDGVTAVVQAYLYAAYPETQGGINQSKLSQQMLDIIELNVANVPRFWVSASKARRKEVVNMILSPFDIVIR